MQEILQILEKLAQTTKVSAGKKLRELAEDLSQKLNEARDFHSPQLQDIVVGVMKDKRCEHLIAPYLEYRRQCNESDAEVNATDTFPVVTACNYQLPWERNKIATALEREGNLPPDIAQEIAQAVEGKIHRAKTRYITTAQIRGLVNSELFSRGYSNYLQRQSLLSIPKFNLKSLLYPKYLQGACKDIEQLTLAIASVILRQYSMEEVFAPEVVNAHLNGEIHIEGISCPMKIFSLLLAPEPRSVFGKSENFDDLVIFLMASIEKILPFMQDTINIYRVDKYFGQILETRQIRSLLTAITLDFQRATPSCFMFDENPGPFVSRWCKVYEQADKLNRRGLLPYMVLPISEEAFCEQRREHTKKACEVALKMHKITFSFASFQGCWPNPDEITWALDSIFINLVQAACKAKKNIGKFWDELNRIFTIVVKAHLDKRRFLLSLSEGPLRLLFEKKWKCKYPIERACCFLEIVGLPESVLCLTGKEMTEEDGWDVAVQTLARLKELTQNVADKHGIQFRLVDYTYNDRAEKRFIKLDMERFFELKKDLPDAVYTRGPHFRLATPLSPRDKIAMEGKLHPYFPSAVPLMPEMDCKELYELLQFTQQNTEAVALKIC